MNSRVIQRVTQPVQYLAGSEDLEHKGQPVRDELLGILLFLDAAELFQETLDQRSAVLMETRAQRLHPRVQSPRDACETVTWQRRATHAEIVRSSQATNRGSGCLW